MAFVCMHLAIVSQRGCFSYQTSYEQHKGHDIQARAGTRIGIYEKWDLSTVKAYAD